MFLRQLDALAYLPALAAVIVWQYGDPERRGIRAGVLIGLAAATVSAQVWIAQPTSRDSGDPTSLWQSSIPSRSLKASHAPGSICASI